MTEREKARIRECLYHLIDAVSQALRAVDENDPLAIFGYIDSIIRDNGREAMQALYDSEKDFDKNLRANMSKVLKAIKR